MLELKAKFFFSLLYMFIISYFFLNKKKSRNGMFKQFQAVFFVSTCLELFAIE